MTQQSKLDSELIAFFGLTFLISWTFTIPLALRSLGILNIGFGGSTFIAGFGPSIAAILITYRSSGTSGVSSLLKKLINISVRGRWYLFAFFGSGILGIAAFIMDAFIAGRPPNFMWATNFQAFPLIFLLVFSSSSLGEELGWRGYALDRLNARFSADVANVILGLLLSIWNLPLFFITGRPQTEIPLLGFMLQTIGLTFLYSWLYKYTDGSVFLAMIFHAASRSYAEIIPYLPLTATHGTTSSYIIFIGLIWLLVAAVRPKLKKG